MPANADKLKNPACGRQVARDNYAVDYLGMYFAFYSQQYQAPFQARSHGRVKSSRSGEGRKTMSGVCLLSEETEIDRLEGRSSSHSHITIVIDQAYYDQGIVTGAINSQCE